MKRFLKDERGVSAIEYALIATLIGIAAVVAMTNVGTGVGNRFNAANNAMK